MFALQCTAFLLGLLGLLACATGRPLDAIEALRPVDGDVAVLALYERGYDVERSLAVAREVRAQVARALGPRVRPESEVRRAITAQLEGASLLPDRRRELLELINRSGTNPVDGLTVLRAHRAATVIDHELRARARTLFMQAATEAVARGHRAEAQALLAELRGWLSDTVAAPGELEVPGAVLAIWRDLDHATPDDAMYRHARPFLSLLPYGRDKLALASHGRPAPGPDVIEQAARLGLALRLDAIILAGVIDGERRAFVIDVMTRTLVSSWEP